MVCGYHVLLPTADLTPQWPDAEKPKELMDRTCLPSAPRASTALNIDSSRIPKKPPYTVFLGNLSYEASEEDITRFFEAKKLEVRGLGSNPAFLID